jgi:hypothetical protein
MVFGKRNEVEVNRIHGILKVIKERIGSPEVKDIIIRGDAGFGISTIIDILYSQRFLYGKENRGHLQGGSQEGSRNGYRFPILRTNLLTAR